jgi:hypothetical protein
MKSSYRKTQKTLLLFVNSTDMKMVREGLPNRPFHIFTIFCFAFSWNIKKIKLFLIQEKKRNSKAQTSYGNNRKQEQREEK